MIIVDLKSAYLPIHIAEKLWRYQLVRYKGQTYYLTSLGFSLNSVPKIMTAILKNVVGEKDAMRRATDSCIYDIMVDETVAVADQVICHLDRFKLTTKQPELLEGGVALGLQFKKNTKDKMVFPRGNDIPDEPDMLSRRKLLSICGKLVGWLQCM